MAPADIERLADQQGRRVAGGLGKHRRCRAAGTGPADPYPAGPEVLRWFKARGPGYQTCINALLRAFVQVRQRAERAGS